METTGKAREIEMPFGTRITVYQDKSASIVSNLSEQFEKPDETSDAQGQAASDALESFLLALAAEGVDVSDERITTALETSVQAIGNSLD